MALSDHLSFKTCEIYSSSLTFALMTFIASEESLFKTLKSPSC